MLSIINNWFYCYRGQIYANKPLGIHHRINNKELITLTFDPGDSTQPETDDTPWFDEDFDDQ